MIIYAGNQKNSYLKPIGLKNSVGLSYADWKGDISMVWGYFTGKYSKEWLDAVKTVCDEINYNESAKQIINLIWIPGTYIEGYEYEKFFNTLNAYGNVVTKITKTEYDDTKGDAYNDYTIQQTQKATGYNLTLVKRILKQLYWSTVQERIETDKWLRPITFASYDEIRKPRPDIKGNEWLDEVLTWAKWIAIIFGVSIAGIFLFQIYSTYKTAKNG